jgi:hypothetical protein
LLRKKLILQKYSSSWKRRRHGDGGHSDPRINQSEAEVKIHLQIEAWWWPKVATFSPKLPSTKMMGQPRKVDAAPAPAKNEVGHGKLVGRRQQPQKRLPRKVDAAPAPEKMRSATENLSTVASSLKKVVDFVKGRDVVD